MNTGCVKRYVCPNKPVCTTGVRSTFYYPNGGTYAGYWDCNKHTIWGVKESAHKEARYKGKKVAYGTLIYEGQWKDNKRDGYGAVLRRNKDISLIYTGPWCENKKCGIGKKIYVDNAVYFGGFERSRRHGLGIMWYPYGNIYFGDWVAGYQHGLGVMFYANGNHYEGHFARNYKNGEGVFYHNHTGQIQKGMWEFDNAKTSIMQDEIRNQGDQPTPYPIPPLKLKDPNNLVRELFKRYIANGKIAPRKFSEKTNLQINRMLHCFASYEERFTSPSKIDLYTDFGYPCVCRKPEKFVTLRCLDETSQYMPC